MWPERSVQTLPENSLAHRILSHSMHASRGTTSSCKRQVEHSLECGTAANTEVLGVCQGRRTSG